MSALERAASTLISVQIPARDTEVERILHDAKNFSTRSDGVLLMVSVPNQDERKALSVRQRQLAESMTFDRKTVGNLIAQLLNCYPNPIKENETVEEVISLFVRELSIEPKVPTWAVSQAVSAVRLGQVQGVEIGKRPSTITVRRVADSFAWKVKAEIVNIQDVLKGRPAAPQVSPAQRVDIGRRFDRLAHELRERNAGRDAQDAAEDAARLAAMVGQAAFDALPDAKRKPHGGQLGRVAAKVAQRA